MVKNQFEVKKRIFSKKSRLIKQLNAAQPVVLHGVIADGHIRKLRNSQEYLEEIEEVEFCLTTGRPVILVSSVSEFEKLLHKSCMKWITFEGTWCQAALVCEELGKKNWVIRMAPVEDT
ncbi:MAG: hypothetical protein J6C46_09690 [Clostridia bacterium]|nr:hypothetical protein [Clostridia bacterium]